MPQKVIWNINTNIFKVTVLGNSNANLQQKIGGDHDDPQINHKYIKGG